MMKKAPEEEPTIWNMEYSRKDSRSPANAAAGSAGRDDEGVTDEDRSIGHISSAGKKSTTTSQLKHDDDFYLKSPFPWKLQQMLEDVSSENKEEIISWVPEGNAFQIHRSSSFERDIMPKYFRQTKYKSFTRQLYMYGFMRIQAGYYRGAFFHPQFIRGNKRSIITMTRKKKTDNQSLPVVGPPCAQHQASTDHSTNPSRSGMIMSQGSSLAAKDYIDDLNTRRANLDKLVSEYGYQQRIHHLLQPNAKAEQSLSQYPPQKIPASSSLGSELLQQTRQQEGSFTNKAQLPPRKGHTDDERFQQTPSIASRIPPIMMGSDISNAFPMFSNTDAAATRIQHSNTNGEDNDFATTGNEKTSRNDHWMQKLIDTFMVDIDDGSFDLEPKPIEEMMDEFDDKKLPSRR